MSGCGSLEPYFLLTATESHFGSAKTSQTGKAERCRDGRRIQEARPRASQPFGGSVTSSCSESELRRRRNDDPNDGDCSVHALDSCHKAPVGFSPSVVASVCGLPVWRRPFGTRRSADARRFGPVVKAPGARPHSCFHGAMHVSALVSVSTTVSARAVLFCKRWLHYAGSFPTSCPWRAAAGLLPCGGPSKGRWQSLVLWTALHAFPGECAPFLRAQIRRLAWRELCPGVYHAFSFEGLLFGHRSFQP